MTTLTVTEARQDFFRVVEKSVKSNAPIRITSKSGDVLIVSEEDYDNLLEKLELLSTPGMVKSIRQAKADIKAGRTKSLKEVFGR